jgi:hypothetical protein
MIIAIFSCFSISLLSALVMSVKKNIEFMETFDDIQESLQRSLEILEEQKEKISQKSKLEVFSDEPVVRNLIRDIVESKNAVISVAKLLDDSLVEEINESKEAKE